MNLPALEPSTEAQFFAEYDKMKSDLAFAREQVTLLSNQLRDANTENEKLAYKNDYLVREVKRITDSRDQYERISIRVVGKLDGALDAWIAMAESMKNEMQEAAFTKVPPIAIVPNGHDKEPEGPTAEEVGRKFGSGFGTTVPRAV